MQPRQPRRGYSTSRPPPPRPYNPTERGPKPSPPPQTPPTTPRRPRTFLSWLNPFAPPAPKQQVPVTNTEPQDISRGWEATRKVITTGVLEPRYRPAARRVTAIIVGLPIVIGLGYELFQRRFLGKERKVLEESAKEREKGGGGESVPVGARTLT